MTSLQKTPLQLTAWILARVWSSNFYSGIKKTPYFDQRYLSYHWPNFDLTNRISGTNIENNSNNNRKTKTNNNNNKTTKQQIKNNNHNHNNKTTFYGCDSIEISLVFNLRIYAKKITAIEMVCRFSPNHGKYVITPFFCLLSSPWGAQSIIWTQSVELNSCSGHRNDIQNKPSRQS